MTGRKTTAMVAGAALLACLAAALLAAPRGAEAAFPGENGRLAFAKDADTGGSNYQIYSVQPDGSGEKRLTNTPAPAYNTEPSYSADGAKIAWNRNGDVWTMDADGTDKRRLTGGPAQDFDPAFSPDGRAVAFARYTAEDDRTDIYVKSLGGGLRQVTDDGDLERNLSFGPNGYRIAFTLNEDEAIPGCNGCVYPSEVATVRADGTGRRVVTDTPGREGASNPDWSPDGRTLVFTHYDDNDQEQARVETVRADGTGRRTVSSRDASQPVFSPDGAKIAFRDVSTRDVWTINADGTGPANVTGTPGELEVGLSWGRKPQAGN